MPREVITSVPTGMVIVADLFVEVYMVMLFFLLFVFDLLFEVDLLLLLSDPVLLSELLFC